MSLSVSSEVAPMMKQTSRSCTLCLRLLIFRPRMGALLNVCHHKLCSTSSSGMANDALLLSVRRNKALATRLEGIRVFKYILL